MFVAFRWYILWSKVLDCKPICNMYDPILQFYIGYSDMTHSSIDSKYLS